MSEIINEFIKKCFIQRDSLIISILKMATGKELEELEIDDAAKLTIIQRQGELGRETVLFDGKEIGVITYEMTALKTTYTFTPKNEQK